MTLADKIRGVVTAGEEVTAVLIGERMGVRTYAELGKIRDAIGWMKKEGEVESVRRGVYVFRKVARRWTFLDVVWHLVRSHRTFTADEIERLSGASRETVKEYLQCLVRAGYLRKPNKSTWHLVKDPGPIAPVNTAKCKRLKRIRAEVRDPASVGGTQRRRG